LPQKGAKSTKQLSIPFAPFVPFRG